MRRDSPRQPSSLRRDRPIQRLQSAWDNYWNVHVSCLSLSPSEHILPILPILLLLLHRHVKPIEPHPPLPQQQVTVLTWSTNQAVLLEINQQTKDFLCHNLKSVYFMYTIHVYMLHGLSLSPLFLINAHPHYTTGRGRVHWWSCDQGAI